jgi:succinoglycan biosynthesis transport protein ExoP
MESFGRDELTSLREYLRVLRLRKWAIILPALLIPLTAVYLSLREPELYEASAEVYVDSNTQNLASALSGLPDFSAFYEDPERTLRTQVDLARVPDVARRVLQRAGVRDRTPGDLLGSSSVEPKGDVDMLVFTVTDTSPSVAARLATAYGREFSSFRQNLISSAFADAEEEIQQRLDDLRSARRTNSAIYVDLNRKLEQLRTVDALQTVNTYLARPSRGAVQVQPRPLRSGVLGLGLGLLFGVGLAFLWHALDTRVRSGEEIGQRLGLPLLARIPESSRRRRKGVPLAMIDDPQGAQAEASRLLRTNLDFVNLERGAQTIMFTSAVQGEGKSTTMINLGLALARAGRRVTLVDLDLRRPSLGRLLHLEAPAGLTDIALGRVSIEEAVIRIPSGDHGVSSRENGDRPGSVEPGLEVVVSGPPPPDPGEFIETTTLVEILTELRQRSGLVLIDAPPMLGVGDAMALSAKVDALILVTRLNVIRRTMVHELHRLLEACPATKLGFVVTGVSAADGYGYGGYYYSSRRSEAQGVRVR